MSSNIGMLRLASCNISQRSRMLAAKRARLGCFQGTSLTYHSTRLCSLHARLNPSIPTISSSSERRMQNLALRNIKLSNSHLVSPSFLPSCGIKTRDSSTATSRRRSSKKSTKRRGAIPSKGDIATKNGSGSRNSRTIKPGRRATRVPMHEISFNAMPPLDADHYNVDEDSTIDADDDSTSLSSSTRTKNSRNTRGVLNQYYTLLKMERHVHKVCHSYVWRMYPDARNFPPVDLFVQLAESRQAPEPNKSTSIRSDETRGSRGASSYRSAKGPVKIYELPNPLDLSLLSANPQIAHVYQIKNLSVYSPTLTMEDIRSTEGRYREVMTNMKRIVLGWSSLPTHAVPHIAGHHAEKIDGNEDDADDSDGEDKDWPSHASRTSRSKKKSKGRTSSLTTVDDSIPLNLSRAESWLYVMEEFRSAREEIVRFVRNGEVKHQQQRSEGGTEAGIFGAVTSFVRSMLKPSHAKAGGDKELIWDEALERESSSSGSGGVAGDDSSKDTQLTDDQGGQDDQKQEELAHLTEDFCPNAQLYLAVLTSYSKVYHQKPLPATTKRLEALLSRMDSAYASGNIYAKPTVAVFHLLMKHYGQIRIRTLARKADALLQRMDAESSAHGMHSAMKIGAPAHSSDMEGGGEAVSTLSNLVTPTAETIRLVMWAYARVKRSVPSALRCESLLERMEAAEAEGNLHLAPDTEAYNICLRAFLNASSGGSPGIVRYEDFFSRVENILRRMENKQKEGHSDVAPNSMTYNMAIAIFSASDEKEDHERALRLLRRMENESLKQQGEGEGISSSIGLPSTFAYNAFLQSLLTHLDQKEQVDYAEKLYNNMVGHSDSKPDYTTFETLFGIFSKAGAKISLKDVGERAEALLSRMEIQYATGNDTVKPDAKMYGYVIRCWANSRSKDLALRANAILSRMERQAALGNKDLGPTLASYAAVINACSNTTELEEHPAALQIAFDCYNKIISLGFSPDAVTYSCLLNCCASLLQEPKQREELAQQVFDAACEQGQVNQAVEYSLRRATPRLYKAYQTQENKEGHSARVPKDQSYKKKSSKESKDGGTTS